MHRARRRPRPPALLAAAVLAACGPEPGAVSVVFSWGPAGPPTEPNATLFVRAAEVDAGAPLSAARTLATGDPVPALARASPSLPAVPHGEGRVVIVEVRESSALESELLRYGVSERFALSPGEERQVAVVAALRRPPSGRGGLTLRGTASSTLTRAAVVDVIFSTDTGVRAEVSNFETFPSDNTRCFALGAAIGGCESTTALPCDAGARCTFAARWDTNLGLEDACEDRDRCARRVFARFYDGEGVASTLASADIVLDTRAPSLLDAAIEYGADPAGVLARVSAAKRGASVALTLAVSEQVQAPPSQLVATSTSGGTLALALRPSRPGDLTFRYTLTLDQPALTDGVYTIEAVALSDLAGNGAASEVSSSFVVRATPPTLTVAQDRLSYVRAPHKSAIAERIGDFELPAGPSYFGLAPSDPLDGAAALPPDTFTLGGRPAAAIRVFSDPSGRSLLLPPVTPDADGRWPRHRLRLPDVDAPRVYVTGFDAAGNESVPVLIEGAWYLRSSAERGRLVRSTDGRWPRAQTSAIAEHADIGALDGAAARAGLQMAWRARGAPAPSAFAGFGGVAWDAARGEAVFLGFFEGSLQTWTWNGYQFTHEAPALGVGGLGDEHLAYDSARGRVVAIGSDRRTWEWDGERWETVASAHVPESTGNGWVMAYHEARRVVVLFGGAGALPGEVSQQTWLWDGVDWTDATQASGNPPPRQYASMVYDAGRREIVLYGGARETDVLTGEQVMLEDTWRWDGQWIEATTAARPAARCCAQLAYDEARARVVLQGGTLDQFGEDGLHDTWEWDGARWIEAQVETPGPAAGVMFYDARRGEVLAWGGEVADQFAPDLVRLRAWDGRRWRVLTSSAAPPSVDAIAYDSHRERAIAVGSGGTFEWDGATWAVSSSTTPGLLVNGWRHLVYDAVRRQMVIVGVGLGSSPAVLETWAFDGARWRLAAAGGPPPRHDAAIAFDADRGQVVLFGGAPVDDYVGPRLADTWGWDGARWTELPPSTSPPGRSAAALAYDTVRRRLVRFAGTAQVIIDPARPLAARHEGFDDVWEWDGATWSELLAPGPRPRGGDRVPLIYDAHLGRTLVVRPGMDAWAWDGMRWVDLSPTGDPLPGPGGVPVAYDARARSAVTYYPSIPSRGHTFSLEPAVPVLQLAAEPPAEVPASAVRALAVRAACGGHDPSAGDGARLVGWTGARWETLATGGSALMVHRARPAEVRGLVNERDGAVFVQCRADADAPSPLSEVTADYVEVWLGYRSPPE